MTINCHSCWFVTLPLCPFHCLWLSLLARIKLKFICGVDSLIGSATLDTSLRTKTQSCISNKKTSKNFYNYINKQETKGSNNCVGEYKNVHEIEKKNVRCCIYKNELILGNLTCSMVVESRNKDVPIFVLVGVSHRVTRLTKVDVDKEGETLVLKKRKEVEWWFSGHTACIKTTVGSLRRMLCEVECWRRPPMSSVWLCVLLCLDLEGILSFIVFSSSNRINFGLSLFFFEGHRLVQKIAFILFFVRNSINISPYAEPMGRDPFFHFEKILTLATSGDCSPVLLFGIVCTIIQKRPLSVV